MNEEEKETKVSISGELESEGEMSVNLQEIETYLQSKMPHPIGVKVVSVYDDNAFRVQLSVTGNISHIVSNDIYALTHPDACLDTIAYQMTWELIKGLTEIKEHLIAQVGWEQEA